MFYSWQTFVLQTLTTISMIKCASSSSNPPDCIRCISSELLWHMRPHVLTPLSHLVISFNLIRQVKNSADCCQPQPADCCSLRAWVSASGINTDAVRVSITAGHGEPVLTITVIIMMNLICQLFYWLIFLSYKMKVPIITPQCLFYPSNSPNQRYSVYYHIWPRKAPNPHIWDWDPFGIYAWKLARVTNYKICLILSTLYVYYNTKCLARQSWLARLRTSSGASNPLKLSLQICAFFPDSAFSPWEKMQI